MRGVRQCQHCGRDDKWCDDNPKGPCSGKLRDIQIESDFGEVV
jgi:hypothetical protein